jgi:hypothetical protein
MKKITMILMVMLSLISLSAINVYIWENEVQTAQIVNAETGYPSSAATAMGNALTELGIENIVAPELTTSLSDYDVIIISSGTFCES